MSWFTEDSTPVLVIGVITVAILLVAFVKTSRLGLLYAIAGVAIVVGAIVWFEKQHDTDTKRVRRLLDAATTAVEKNDVPGLLSLIAPSAQTMRTRVSNALPQVNVDKAWITGLEIKINSLSSPPSAMAEFYGHANGKDRHGLYPYDHFVERFKVTLHLEGDHWLLDGYEEKGTGLGGQ